MKTMKAHDCELRSYRESNSPASVLRTQDYVSTDVSNKGRHQNTLAKFPLCILKLLLCTGFSWYSRSNDLGLLKLSLTVTTTLEAKHRKVGVPVTWETQAGHTPEPRYSKPVHRRVKQGQFCFQLKLKRSPAHSTVSVCVSLGAPCHGVHVERLVRNVLLLQGTLGAQLTPSDFLQQAPLPAEQLAGPTSRI